MKEAYSKRGTYSLAPRHRMIAKPLPYPASPNPDPKEVHTMYNGLPESPELEDIRSNQWIAAAAYLLFFVPLLAAPKSKFAMYHANQGLVLLLTVIAANLVLWLLPLIGLLLVPLANLGLLVLFIMGILNTVNGWMKPLPFIGGLSLIRTP